MLSLAEWLGVEPAILRYGDAVPKAVRERRKRWDEGIGFQEREIFELFLKLPVPQRKVAREVIMALAKAEGVLRRAQAPDRQFGEGRLCGRETAPTICALNSGSDVSTM